MTSGYNVAQYQTRTLDTENNVKHLGGFQSYVSPNGLVLSCTTLWPLATI